MNCSNFAARIFAVAMLLSLVYPAGAQQAYPGKPIRFVVPYPPGGSTTPVARLIGEKLTEHWGQPVLIDNRPGANTMIGTEAVAKSPADGYTILLTSLAYMSTPLVMPTHYDALKDFAPVATLISAELLMALHPGVPANNLQEFIALAKSRPGELNYATSAAGGSTHLAAELLNILAGIKTQHIPYKGGGPALTDLMGGQVQFHFNTPLNLTPHIKSGKLKAIAVTGKARLAALPQVPTFSEAGLPGLDVREWFGIVAPAGTPKPIVDKLSVEIAKILDTPEFKDTVANFGMVPMVATPDQMAALLQADIAKFAMIVKTANIKLE